MRHRTSDDIVLVAATFVGNLFFIVSTPYRATLMVDIVSEYLSSYWGQVLKPDSKQVLAAYGNRCTDVQCAG